MAPLETGNVQGDILRGLPKKTETFYFFRIRKGHVESFRKNLTHLEPLITSTDDVQKDRDNIHKHKKKDYSGNQKPLHPDFLKIAGVNIAFSRKGLKEIGGEFDVDTGDKAFDKGMFNDAEELGDPGKTSQTTGKFNPDWLPAFKEDVHGLILITGDCKATVDEKLAQIKKIFSVGQHHASIEDVTTIVGKVREAEGKSGHEHFGFADGISQPAVVIDDQDPGVAGQDRVHLGIILCGRPGENFAKPPWTLDGSFLTFRSLKQKVPEFKSFLAENALPIPDPTLDPKTAKELGSQLLGARLVGRWESGAPIDLTPLKDAAFFAESPQNNNFSFLPNKDSQDRCPFSAHIRKTYPREHLPSNEKRRIIRRGITYGDEVDEKTEATTTKKDRGLLFVSYSSSIDDGFRFIQKSWANNVQFPVPIVKTGAVATGFDAIIGQTNDSGPRQVSGINSTRLDDDQTRNDLDNLDLQQQWVETKGGEYFFSPSISVLKKRFALHGQTYYGQ